MKDKQPLHNGMATALEAMHHMLVAANDDVLIALQHIRDNEANAAVGGVMPVKEALEQSLALYHAIIAMHRFRL